jgi:hypothetical protein
MPEGVLLTGSDLKTMVDNLCTDGFSGYVKFELVPGKHAYVFIANGDQVRAFEMTDSRAEFKAHKPDRLINMAGGTGGKIPAYSYILSGRLATVLGQSFAFKALYRDYQVRKKELKKVLDNLEHDSHSGFVQFDLPDGRAVVILDKGEPVHDQFISQYGEVLCGRDVITNLFGYVHNQGATVHVYAEKSGELDNRNRRTNEDLEKMIQLTVKGASGWGLGSKDTVKLDLEWARGWGYNGKSTFRIAIEDMEGRRVATCKAQGASKKNMSLEIPTKMLSELGLSDSQEVTVYPDGDE